MSSSAFSCPRACGSHTMTGPRASPSVPAPRRRRQNSRSGASSSSSSSPFQSWERAHSLHLLCLCSSRLRFPGLNSRRTKECKLPCYCFKLDTHTCDMRRIDTSESHKARRFFSARSPFFSVSARSPSSSARRKAGQAVRETSITWMRPGLRQVSALPPRSSSRPVAFRREASRPRRSAPTIPP